jgi:hypothetical protein
MKITIKIGENQYELSDVTDKSIYYSVKELKDLIAHIVEQNNKIEPK